MKTPAPAPAPAKPESSGLHAEPPTVLPPPPMGGRPTLQTPEVVDTICAAIRLHGCSDSAAGLLAGVSTSTISRWKQDDEDFQISIRQARAHFDIERLTQIRESCKRDGTPDWRAHAWLLKISSPQTYGPPARRRRPGAEELKPKDPNAVAPGHLEALQEARLRFRQAAEAAGAHSANIPETPSGMEAMSPTEPMDVTPETALSEAAPAPGANSTNIPETPAAASCLVSPVTPDAAPSPAVPMPPATPANLPKTPASLLKSALAKVAAKLHPASSPQASTKAARRRAAQQQAEEAEEFRRIHEALNREWERQTDAPNEDWKKDVIPGMWAGLY